MIAIDELAKDFELSAEVVADVYLQELEELKQEATIDLHLPLRTRDACARGSAQYHAPKLPESMLLRADEMIN